MTETDIVGIVINWATRLHEVKLATSIAFLLLFTRQIAVLEKERRLEKILLAGEEGPSPVIRTGLIDTVLAARYYRCMYAKAYITSILLFHISLIGILAMHVPVFASILAGTLLARVPESITTILADVMKFSLVWRILSIISLASLITAAYARIQQGSGTRPLILLSLLVILTGLVSPYSSLILHLHAAAGYVVLAYLVSTREGLHWARVLGREIALARARSRETVWAKAVLKSVRSILGL